MCIAKRVIHTNKFCEKVFFNRTTRVRKRLFDVYVAKNTLATSSASLGVNWVADLKIWPNDKQFFIELLDLYSNPHKQFLMRSIRISIP